MIEVVPDSKSRDKIGKQTQASLRGYFHSVYGSEDSIPYQEVGHIIFSNLSDSEFKKCFSCGSAVPCNTATWCSGVVCCVRSVELL